MQAFLDNSELLQLKKGETVFELRKRAPACVTLDTMTKYALEMTHLLATCSLWYRERLQVKLRYWPHLTVWSASRSSPIDLL
jgi:hypothetical protein